MKRVRKVQTAGQSKARDQQRADFRSEVLKHVSDEGVDATQVAYRLGTTPQRAVSALAQLERQGEVTRVSTGFYRRTPYSET